MSVQPNARDTSAAAEHFQIELLRRAGTCRRASLALSWSEMVMGLVRRGLSRLYPSDPSDPGVLFVRLHYGEALATRLRDYLSRRHA